MNYRLRRFDFDLYDYKEAERLLNQMAVEGYEFKRIGKGVFKCFALFEGNEKICQTRYAVDGKGYLEAEEKADYYSFYKELGWEAIACKNKSLHIFRRKDMSIQPLYDDSFTEYENFKEAISYDSQTVKYGAFIIAAVLFLKFYIDIGRQVPPSIAVGLFMALTCYGIVYAGAVMVNNIIYKKAWKRSGELGQSLPENTILKRLKFIHNTFSIILFGTISIAAIAGYYYITKTGGQPADIPWWGSYIVYGIGIALPLWVVADWFRTLESNNRLWSVISFISFMIYYLAVCTVLTALI